MTSNFDNLIHQLMNAHRPKDGKEDDIKTLVSKLVHSTGETQGDDQNGMWKRMLLSLLYKRYHMLSPERQESSASTAGDGERLIFYTAIATLLEHQAIAGTTENATVHRTNVSKALQLLCQLSPLVGGSRDVCKLMEVFVVHFLEQVGQANRLQLEQDDSHSMNIAQAVDLIETELQASGDVGPFSGLRWLLDFSARQLTSDLDMIQNADSEQNDPPSTLHVFIPHNKRGRTRKMRPAGVRASNIVRNLVNCSLEILIWSRSEAAMKNRAFLKALATFREPANIVGNKKDAVKSAVMTMQTVIRKFRQKLNHHGRDKGYMLTDLYRLEPSKLTLQLIQHGKCGDLSMLTKLATKKSSTAILQMIQARFASDPRKITKYASIGELAQSFGATKVDTTANEGDVLLRAIQVSRLSATIQHMRDAFAKKSGNKNQGLVIASIDRSSLAGRNLNHIAAMLVAAAMQNWPLDRAAEAIQDEENEKVKLVLGKSKQHFSSFQEFVVLLDSLLTGDLKIELDVDTFVGGEGTDETVATTKAVLNVIDRHVVGFGPEGGGDTPKSNFLLFTSAGVRLPLDVQKAFTSAGYRIHCHDSDDIGDRLHREKARLGDITISLAWDTFDDLDLHVILPSEEEISFSNRHSISGRACLDVDMNAGGGDSEQPVENVYLGDADKRIEAIHGTYKVFVTNFAYHTNDTNAAIQWRVVIDMNGQKQRFLGECRGEQDASDKIVCEFDYTGRTVPFPGEEKDSFDTSNLVDLTTSTGQTLDSVSQLLTAIGDLEVLDDVQVLAMDDADTEDMQVEESPTEAGVGSLRVTSHNLLDIKLSKLPRRFHKAVSGAFGGASFAEECAEVLARQMVKERIPLKELSHAGYPPDVIDAVKSKLVSAVGAIIV